MDGYLISRLFPQTVFFFFLNDLTEADDGWLMNDFFLNHCLLRFVFFMCSFLSVINQRHFSMLKISLSTLQNRSYTRKYEPKHTRIAAAKALYKMSHGKPNVTG